ncbi:hypothetical protein FPV67DRAFT_1671432 [Lyophyllum atratum]|nr:hypothetical protein FPV67DRAFT_1671432 [Lyophyllum atratum]
MSTEKTSGGPKKGKDGLTKYQRYYQKHPELREKKRERDRIRRQKLKEESLATSVDNETLEPLLPDFHATAAPYVDKMVQESIVAITAEDTLPEPGSYQELDELNELRLWVIRWGKGWGGISNWDTGLDASYNHALKRDNVAHWREQISKHAQTGRLLLGRVHTMDGSLPTAGWKIRELWREKSTLLDLLVRGVTTLEIKTSILPGLGRVDSLYRELEDAHTSEESAVETDSGSLLSDGNSADDEDETVQSSDDERDDEDEDMDLGGDNSYDL